MATEYRDLLKKYMHLVTAETGVDFVPFSPTADLNTDEVAALREISDELYTEDG